MLNINKYTTLSIEEMDAKPLDVPTLSIQELADKYNVDVSVVEVEVTKGVEVEKEHTTDLEVANEIARDHLKEDLYYYDKLTEMEGKE